jgi:hypothetical protein
MQYSIDLVHQNMLKWLSLATHPIHFALKYNVSNYYFLFILYSGASVITRQTKSCHIWFYSSTLSSEIVELYCIRRLFKM